MNFDNQNIDLKRDNYIKETVCKIDKLQKNVITESSGRCVACETSLLSSVNNTIPVRFSNCCGSPFEALIGITGATTSFFRIESVRCGQFATLQLLEPTLDETLLRATGYTIIVDLDCVCSLQCFEPVNVEICTSSIEG